MMKVSSYSIIILSKSGPITCFGGVGVISIYMLNSPRVHNPSALLVVRYSVNV